MTSLFLSTFPWWEVPAGLADSLTILNQPSSVQGSEDGATVMILWCQGYLGQPSIALGPSGLLTVVLEGRGHVVPWVALSPSSTVPFLLHSICEAGQINRQHKLGASVRLP